MTQDIWVALLLAMHIVGIAASAYWLVLRLLRAKRGTAHILLMQIGENENAQDVLYALHLRRAFLGESERCAIIALDTGLSDDERRRTARFCRSVPQMYLCTPTELSSLLQEIGEHGLRPRT